MSPTLREPCLMEVVPVLSNSIRRGDVILFHCPDETGKNVVHRVIDVHSAALKTRGDNCIQLDPYSVTSDRVIGLVIACWRGNKRRIVYGGTFGRILSWYLLFRAWVSTICRRLLWGDCCGMLTFVIAPVADFILPDRFQPRVIQYPEHARWRYQLFIGNKYIGRFDSTIGKWEIRFPYRLIVDIRKLPHSL